MGRRGGQRSSGGVVAEGIVGCEFKMKARVKSGACKKQPMKRTHTSVSEQNCHDGRARNWGENREMGSGAATHTRCRACAGGRGELYVERHPCWH